MQDHMNSPTRLFQELMESSPAQRQEFDFAEMNLLCADDLPGAESIDCSLLCYLPQCPDMIGNK